MISGIVAPPSGTLGEVVKEQEREPTNRPAKVEVILKQANKVIPVHHWSASLSFFLPSGSLYRAQDDPKFLIFALNFPSAGITGLHHQAKSPAFLYLFETGSHKAGQTGLEVLVLLP